MDCLHFKTDRVSGICPDCGWVSPAAQAAPPAGARSEVIAAPVPPPLSAEPAEDIHALIAAARKKTSPVQIPVQPVPIDPLRAEADAAVEKATPDWIKDGRIAIPVPEGSTPGIHDSVLAVTPELSDVRLQELCAPTTEEIERNAKVADILEQVGSTDDAEIIAPGTYPDEPIFKVIAGTAGTGKTTLARKRADNYDDAILVATTGIAAINIGGTTINSKLMYGDTDGMRASYETGKLGAVLRRLMNSGYYRLIIDEISMMDGHQLDILVMAVEEINQWALENGKRQMGITLVGDFAQLPPVKAPFVFQRPSWGRFEPNIELLTKPWRQADPQFVAALQAVRRGDRAAALSYFGPMLVQGSEDTFDGSTILATNAEVDRYNKLRLMNLTTPAAFFKADRVGEQLSEWTKNIPDQLEMKPGALVMILANKTSEGTMIYANGSLGHYVGKVSDGKALVELKDGSQTVTVEAVLKEKREATGNAGVKAARDAVKGSVRYMPLRVAYATTCHKSQGLSLDRVQILFHNKFWATAGMLYVGLSRCRTVQGLRLVGTKEQFEARITVNPDVRRWL